MYRKQDAIELEVTEEMRKLLVVCGPSHAPVQLPGGEWVVQYFRDRPELARRRAAEQFVDARLRGVEVPAAHVVVECICGKRLLNPSEDRCQGCRQRAAAMAEMHARPCLCDACLSRALEQTHGREVA